jgi:hypothetical protein
MKKESWRSHVKSGAFGLLGGLTAMIIAIGPRQFDGFLQSMSNRMDEMPFAPLFAILAGLFVGSRTDRWFWPFIGGIIAFVLTATYYVIAVFQLRG